MVLSPVEQRIKEKVENIGIPLKEWDLDIYRGILTGYNKAFIIDQGKRDELVKASPKSEEIIRPILRGRDIKKYNANWDGIYLIATLPSKKINIDNFPTIEDHLSSYGQHRLEQTGAKGSRKKTGNKWFETQDQIKYWKNFDAPKIIYPEITKFLNFYLDSNENYYVNNKCFILNGEYLEYLVTFFNSPIFRYCFKDNFPELIGGTRELRKVFFEQIPVKKVTKKINDQFRLKLLELEDNRKNRDLILKELNQMIYEYYNLDTEEIRILESK